MRVLLASPIDPEAIERLRQRHDIACAFGAGAAELPSLLPDCEALVFRSGVDLSRPFLDGAPALKLIVRAGSGLDNIDLDRVRELGIRLVRIPGPSARAVAELAFALLLSVARNVALADREIREAHWPKPSLGGPLLAGKTLGVVGVGNIGTRVGRMAAAWEMRPVGCVKRYSAERAAQNAELGIELVESLDEVLAQADFVTVHVPMKDDTRHLIGGSELAAMKPDSILVNTSRGGVVDEDALLEALTRGDLAGAGLDVHEREGEGVTPRFAGLPNVVLTPHIGGMATDAQRDIGLRVIEMIDAFVADSLDVVVRDGELVV